MPRRARWALAASTGLLFLAGYMALASVQSYGTPLLVAAVIVLALSPLGERLDRAAPGYRMITKAVAVAYFCFIPVSVFAFGLLNGVIALIIFIQFHTMLHNKDEKNYYHVFLMSFFLLIAACVQSPEASISFVLLLFLASTIWCFFSLRVAFEAEESQSHLAADIVRFGEEPLRAAHDHRDPFDLGVVGYLAVVIALSGVITVAIFFATPRVEAGLLGRSNNAMTITGVPDKVRLISGRTIQQDFTPVLRAEFPDDPGGRPVASPLYWRVNTLPKFDGASWEHANLEEDGEPAIDDNGRFGRHFDAADLRRKPRDGAEVEHQVIYMDEVPTAGMPALDLVQRVALGNAAAGVRLTWADYNDFTVILMNSASRQMRYEAWSEVDEPPATELRQDNGPYENLKEPDRTLLTETRLLPETVALAKRLTAAGTSRYDQVMLLMDFLSGNNFLYSLSVPALPAEYAVDAFINRTRVGHCELYATALAQMVRSLGIPARVVSGYKGGEFDEGDRSFVVRRAMAHLWVEVLFPSHGWVKFDPSPQSDANENPGVIQRMRMAASIYALRARMYWFSNIIGYQGMGRFDLRSLQFSLFNEIKGLQAKASDAVASGTLVKSLLGASIGIGTVLSVGWFTYRALSDARSLRRSALGVYTLTREQRRAISLYRALRKRLKKLGVETAGRTAEELLEEIGKTDWPQKAEAQRLLSAYNEVRFGARPLPGERLAELWRALRALKRARV